MFKQTVEGNQMKMKSIILCMFLTGCGTCSRNVAFVTGHDIVCIDGIRYIQFPSGVVTKLNPDGKPEVCK